MQKRASTMPALIWKRLLAFLVDLAILDLIVFAPFSSVFADKLANTDFASLRNLIASEGSMVGPLTWLMFVLGVIAVLYFAILEYRIQQTAGKILLRLYVAPQTRELKFWQCLVRALFIIPVFPFILFWIIDPITMLFTQNNQRLLERLSYTMTVEKMPEMIA